MQIHTLIKRHEFLRVQAAPRVGTATLVLHRLTNPELAASSCRIGYTVTKRCGNAVTRNRIKRRLRAAARELIPAKGEACCDYVLIGKPATATAPFSDITRDLAYALKRAAKPQPAAKE